MGAQAGSSKKVAIASHMSAYGGKADSRELSMGVFMSLRPKVDGDGGSPIFQGAKRSERRTKEHAHNQEC